MKQHEIGRLACEGRLFVLSCRCTFDIEQFFWKVGQTYGKRVLRESVMLVTISAVLYSTSPAPMATHMHLLTAAYIKSPHYTVLPACCDTPFRLSLTRCGKRRLCSMGEKWF